MLLKANYHTHTKRCGHAGGTDREYVEKAIEDGIKVLGFSDHAPMFYDTPGFVSGCRMALTEIDDYCRSITELKREYRNDIEIRLGFSEERHYSYAPFWRLAGQVGNRAVIGVDAHSPAHFDDAAAVEGLRKLAEASGVEILDELVL